MLDKYKYVELVTGGVNNRGAFIEQRDPWFHSINGDLKDCFHSAFIQTEDIVTYDDGKGGKSGYNGSVSSEYLYWDIDNTDLEKAANDTRVLVDRLIKEFKCSVENIAMFFSGNKGFHVLYKCPELKLVETRDNQHEIVKNVCSTIAHNIESFDTHIYDKTRIIRVVNTVNSKTGLYKIQIPEIEKIDEIKEKAKTFGIITPIKGITESPVIRQLLAHLNISEQRRQKQFTQQKLLDGIKYGFGEGERNSGLTSVAGLLHSRNLSHDFISSVLSSINSSATNPVSDGEISNIVNSVSKYSINPLFISPMESDVLTIEDAYKRWVDLRTRTARLKSGFSHIDASLPFFDPGEVLMIAARSGVGKTTLGMQLSNGIARGFNGYGLFASLEMPITSIFARTAIIESSKQNKRRCEYEEVAKFLFEDKKLVDSIIDEWKNLLLIDKTCLSVEQIKQYFELANEAHEGKVTNLFVDYAGLIYGSDDYEGLSKNARAIKNLAKSLNTRIILIVQLSRKAGDGTIPVSLDMLRDSGALEEAADYVMGIWHSSTNAQRLHAALVKNRFGERGQRFDLINMGLSYTTVDAEASHG